jgi:hypothetical protein
MITPKVALVAVPVVGAAVLQAEALDISPLLALLADAPILAILLYLYIRQMKHHELITEKFLEVLKEQNARGPT